MQFCAQRLTTEVIVRPVMLQRRSHTEIFAEAILEKTLLLLQKPEKMNEFKI